MRSKTDLIALCEKHGIQTIVQSPNVIQGRLMDVMMSREEMMDALRAKLGTFDPEVQLDPAKAKDLKNEIDWATPGPGRFAKITKYFNEAWVLEPKLDGARIRMFLGATANTMNSGRRSDVTYTYIERADNFPHLRDAVYPPLAGTVLDAELMPAVNSVTTKSGVVTKGSLNTVMAMLNVNPAAGVALQEKYGRAKLMVFDVLMVCGDSVMDQPAWQRRQALEMIVDHLHVAHPGIEIVLVPQMESCVANIEKCLADGYEGAMLKKKDAPYLPGKRMAAWQKVKVFSTGDFFIIGSVDGNGRNEGKVGSLKVAWFDAEHPSPLGGAANVYCADVAGITDAFRDELTGPDGKVDPKWLGAVIEVMAQGSTKNGRLRHPGFVRVRPDKCATDCGREQFDLFVEV